VLSVSKRATGAIRVLLSFIGMAGFMPASLSKIGQQG